MRGKPHDLRRFRACRSIRRGNIVSNKRGSDDDGCQILRNRDMTLSQWGFVDLMDMSVQSGLRSDFFEHPHPTSCLSGVKCSCVPACEHPADLLATPLMLSFLSTGTAATRQNSCGVTWRVGRVVDCARLLTGRPPRSAGSNPAPSASCTEGWCKGSTADFGSASQGSNPCPSASFQRVAQPGQRTRFGTEGSVVRIHPL